MVKTEIHQYMARAFFACAWADQQEAMGCSFSGMEIMDVLPAEIDPAALAAATDLITSMEHANGCSIGALLERCAAAP